MNRFLVIIGLGASAVLVACNKESANSGGGPAQSAPVAPPVAPGIDTAAAPPAPPALGGAAMPPGQTAGQTPSGNSTASDRPVHPNGLPMSDLEWLNDALTNYRELLSQKPIELKGTFRSEAEEMAARAAAEKLRSEPVIRDLSDLVRAGVIKSIPPAPDGKKYVIDPKTQKVVLQ